MVTASGLNAPAPLAVFSFAIASARQQSSVVAPKTLYETGGKFPGEVWGRAGKCETQQVVVVITQAGRPSLPKSWLRLRPCSLPSPSAPSPNRVRAALYYPRRTLLIGVPSLRAAGEMVTSAMSSGSSQPHSTPAPAQQGLLVQLEQSQRIQVELIKRLKVEQDSGNCEPLCLRRSAGLGRSRH